MFGDGVRWLITSGPPEAATDGRSGAGQLPEPDGRARADGGGACGDDAESDCANGYHGGRAPQASILANGGWGGAARRRPDGRGESPHDGRGVWGEWISQASNLATGGPGGAAGMRNWSSACNPERQAGCGAADARGACPGTTWPMGNCRGKPHDGAPSAMGLKSAAGRAAAPRPLGYLRENSERRVGVGRRAIFEGREGAVFRQRGA
jgi:hypothetical protein